MVDTLQFEGSPSHPWRFLTALFPSLRVRFAAALLLTFFPFGILYPLQWPLRELVTLIAWLAVFPSVAGILCVVLVPLLPNDAYGYWAFNVICFVATLAIAKSAARRGDFQAIGPISLHRFARVCVLVTVVIGACQVLSPAGGWTAVFKEMTLGDGGRAAGLRSEPSLLAAPLAIYLALLVSRMKAPGSRLQTQSPRNYLLLEGLTVAICMIAMTRSISVLIIAVCFAPLLGLRLRRAMIAAVGVLGGATAAVIVLGERIRQALQDSGSALDLISVGLNSWRNIPDFLMILNYRDFLLPGNPADIRTKISALAASWSPAFAWIQNTYSTFSAGTSTLGLLATTFLFVVGIAMGVRSLSSGPLRLTWLMLYVAGWFILPKFEAAGWVALGLLILLHRPNGSKRECWAKKLNRLLGLSLFRTVKLTLKPHGDAS